MWIFILPAHYTYTVRKAIKTVIVDIVRRRALAHYTYTVRKAIKTSGNEVGKFMVTAHYTYTVRKAIKTPMPVLLDVFIDFSLYIHSP